MDHYFIFHFGFIFAVFITIKLLNILFEKNCTTGLVKSGLTRQIIYKT